MRLALVAVSLVAAITAPSARGELRIVAQSGTSPAGFATAEFVDPVAVSKQRTVFRAVRYALTREVDGTTRKVLATGDALAPPLDGSLNAIGEAVLGTLGVLAVSTNVNSVDGADVVFLVEGDVVTPAVVSPATSGLGLVSLGINGRADLVYWNAHGIFSWLRATGASTQIGTFPRRGRIRRVRPTILDDGEIAWLLEGREGGIFYWSPERGSVTVFSDDLRRSSRLRRLGLALDASFGVGFLAGRTSAYAGVWSPVTGMISTAASIGAAVGERQIYRFLELKGFAPDGSLDLFVEPRGHRPLRSRAEVWAKDGVIVTAPAPPTAPAPASTAPYVVTATQALLARTGEETTSLLAPGDVLGSAGRVVTVERHAAGDGVVAFVALTDSDARVVGQWRNGKIKVLETAEADGETALAPFDGQLAAGRAGVAYVRGQDVALRRGGLQLLKLPARKRFADPGLVRLDIAGHRVVVRATYQSADCDGIFVSRGRALLPIATAGTETCGRRGKFEELGDIAADGAAILYAALAPNRPTSDLVVRRGAQSTLLSTTVVGADGSLVPVEPSSVELTDGRALFLAEDPATRMMALFEAHPDSAVPLLQEGDATSLGTVRFDTRNVETDPRVSAAGGAVVFSAALMGGPVRNAIVAADLPE